MAPSPIRLRGHHLLCILTYTGKGYTDAFVANFDTLCARLSGLDAPLVEIVAGPDDICAPLLAGTGAGCGSAAHCHEASPAARDALALEGLNALCPDMPRLQIGSRLRLDAARLREWRAGFAADLAAGTLRRACVGCEWFDYCSHIAAADFTTTRLAD